MAEIKAVINALRKSALEIKAEKRITDTIDHISSHLILLNSSSPSVQASQKLNSVLRKPLIPLYKLLLVPTLCLSAALYTNIHDTKIATTPDHDPEKHHLSFWEIVQKGILSGVMDYMDEYPSEKARGAVAELFYPILCTRHFSPTSSIYSTGVGLSSTVHQLLCQTAEAHSVNQHKLRDPLVFGGKRLGTKLSLCKDFLVMESLLSLFVCLLPSVKSFASGRSKRTQFLHEVFGEQFECNEELISFLESNSSTDWDIASMRIFDILGRASIDFPQPFLWNEFRVCGINYPQTDSSQRLYLDNTAFLANILDDDNAFDSFTLLYSGITKIQLARNASNTSVTVHLCSPFPNIGDMEIKPTTNFPAPTMEFSLQNESVERFLHVLRSRGLGDRIPQNQSVRSDTIKLSISLSPACLGFYSRDVTPDAETSFQEKVDNVERLYQTEKLNEDELPPIPPAPSLEAMHSTTVRATTPTPALGSYPSEFVPKETRKLDSDAMLTTPVPKLGLNAAVIRSSSVQSLHEAVFGTSDEELSDLSDADEAELKPRKNSANTSRGNRNASRTSFAATTASVHKGRRVVDSEDETEGKRVKHKQKTAKKAIVMDSEYSDDQYDSSPTRRISSRLKSADDLRCASTHRSRNTSVCPPPTVASTAGENTTDNLVVGQSKVAGNVNEPPVISPPSKSVLTILGKGPDSKAISSNKPSTSILAENSTKPTPFIKADIQKITKSTQAPARPNPPTKKRKRESETTNLEARANRRPVKKRNGAQIDARDLILPSKAPEAISSLAKTTKSTKKYKGKKGLVTPPTPIRVSDIDFDKPLRDQPSLDKAPLLNPSPKPNRVTRARAIASKTKAPDTVDAPQAAVNLISGVVTEPSNDGNKHTSSVTLHVPPVIESDLRPPKEVREIEMHTPDGRISSVMESKIDNKMKEGDEPLSGKKNKGKQAPWDALEFLDTLRANVNSSSAPPDNNQLDILGHDYSDTFVQGGGNFMEPEFHDHSTPAKSVVESAPKSYKEVETILTSPVPSSARKTLISVAPEQQDDISSFKRDLMKPVSTRSKIEISTPVLPYPGVQLTPNTFVKEGNTLLFDFASSKQRKDTPPESDPTPTQPKITFKSSTRQEKHGGELGDIVNVLNDIHKVLVNKITRRFETVESGARSDGQKILQEGAADMRVMHTSSAKHYNVLVDLEREYASHSRKLIAGLGDVVKVNQGITQGIDDIIQSHDRNSLSKRLPNSFFTAPLPDIFLNPVIPFKY